MTATDELVRFDHHSLEYARNYRQILRKLRETAPVAWTEAYGGYWIVSNYELVMRVAEDAATFSSENRIGTGDESRRGVMIPQMPEQLPLNEVDAPHHTKRRMLMAPLFTPRYLQTWVEAAVKYTREAIDDVIEKGETEFVRDLLLRVPAMTTLHVAGVDPYDWKSYALPAHARACLPSDHPDFPQEALKQIERNLLALIQERRREPRLDIASALATGKIDGEPLSDELACGMLVTVVTGGFDTATAMMANSLEWLETNPDQREFLRANPEALPNAVEEFLRFFPPLQCLARNATRDVELGGKLIRAGDRVLMSFYGANHDPAKFPDPEQIRFDRKNARDHVSYSAGPHRCLGAALARLEVPYLLGQILQRLPDYRIDHARSERVDTIGVVDGWKHLNATFTPGRRAG